MTPSKPGSPPWNAEPAADRALLAGIAAYRRHSYCRDVPAAPAIWREGAACLRDYRPGGGRPLLVVPSLINRAYILDIQPDHSMLRALAAAGCRPLLLDWGFPGPHELGFTLADTVARLDRALAAIGEPADLAGYCMGGLLAVAAAVLAPDRVRRLALLATPWDFHAPDPAPARQLAGLLPSLEPVLRLTGSLPVDWLQLLFAMLEPGAVPARFRAFATLPPDDPRTTLLVAIEDWLADGVPLAAPITRETMAGWYGENGPARETWRVDGAAIRPAALRQPALIAVPERDRIVPPESAGALAAAMPAARVLRLAAGHVGMVAGSSAPVLWTALATFFGA